MREFLLHNRDLFDALASLAALITLFFVSLAALASRKQNILKTVPLLTLEYKDEKIYIRNVNRSFAYSLRSEPYIHVNADTNPFALMPVGKTVYKLSSSGANYIYSYQTLKPIQILANGEPVNSELRHYLFARLLDNKNGITLFYKDSQNHLFSTRVRSTHDSSTINNIVVFDIVSAPKYMPKYALHLWLKFGIRSLLTYINTSKSMIKVRRLQSKDNSSEQLL